MPMPFATFLGTSRHWGDWFDWFYTYYYFPLCLTFISCCFQLSLLCNTGGLLGSALSLAKQRVEKPVLLLQLPNLLSFYSASPFFATSNREQGAVIWPTFPKT
jgi:hypothetical protein